MSVVYSGGVIPEANRLQKHDTTLLSRSIFTHIMLVSHIEFLPFLQSNQ